MARRRIHGKRKYRRYLKSPHWHQRRRAALAAAAYRCQACGSAVRLEVHHVSYANMGAEQPADLRVLCRECHKAVHGIAHPGRRRR